MLGFVASLTTPLHSAQAPFTVGATKVVTKVHKGCCKRFIGKSKLAKYSG